MPAAHATSRMMVLMFTDVVGSVDLKRQFGDRTYNRLIERHDELYRAVIEAMPSAEIRNDTGDGFLTEFETVSDAVFAALRFQHAVRSEPWSPEPVAVRISVHSGEVSVLPGGKLAGVAVDVAARIRDLAQGGQILLTRPVFENARQFIREHPSVQDAERPGLRWMKHGAYKVKGLEEPVEVFEVGAEGIAPFAPPPRPDGTDSQRTEWRPKPGLEVPRRRHWVIEKKLGEGGFGEVWLAQHQTTKQTRVFKFCFDDEKVRSFRKEMKIYRLLREALGARDDIAQLHEVSVDEPPYFLESDYVRGGNLAEWSKDLGGIRSVPLEQRLEIVARVARAVAAAHSINIIHRDIKPANILMDVDREGAARPRVSDFGIGALTDPSQLARYEITQTGFTLTQGASDETHAATLLYSPPEFIKNGDFTKKGDVYAIGVLLYQMVVGDLRAPLGHGWDDDIEDVIVRKDIGDCVQMDPARRLSTVDALAQRLETLDDRRGHSPTDGAAQPSIVGRMMGVVRRATTRPREAIKAHQDGCYCLAFHPTGGRAASGGADNMIRVWDANMWNLFAELPGHQRTVMWVSYNRDGKLLVSGDLCGTVKVWDADAGKELRSFSTGAIRVVCVPFSPDGLHFASGASEYAVKVWETKSGEERRTLRGHRGTVNGVAFRSDGKRVASCSDDGRIKVWDLASGEEVMTIPGHQRRCFSLSYSADGKRLVSGGDDEVVRLWDAETGDEIRRFIGHKGSVFSTSFAPRGQSVVSSGADSSVRVWDVRRGEERQRLTRHKGRCFFATFSPDGASVVSACEDGRLRVWGVGESA